jgi:hypothetical protein
LSNFNFLGDILVKPNSTPASIHEEIKNRCHKDLYAKYKFIVHENYYVCVYDTTDDLRFVYAEFLRYAEGCIILYGTGYTIYKGEVCKILQEFPIAGHEYYVKVIPAKNCATDNEYVRAYQAKTKLINQ